MREIAVSDSNTANLAGNCRPQKATLQGVVKLQHFSKIAIMGHESGRHGNSKVYV